MANPFDLTGKTALITGANSGIGLGYATAIAQAGGNVVVWGRRAARNAEAAAQLAEFGVRVLTDEIDVADEAAQIAGFERALGEFGRLDCVIANAGFAGYTAMVDLSTEELARHVAISQMGSFVTLREGARHMVKRAEAGDPGGSLIATGSLTNFLGTFGVGHYASAKSAIGAMIRNFAVELGGQGIRANMVCAGLIATDMTGGPESGLKAMAEQRTPIPRMGTPEDLGGIVVYLMSDASKFHTGDLITIDGGRRINGD
ncbi:MAG: SDR family NAD(P)-dependent oxidoreductase [Candidatus Binatia bacterium]|nr:SDR family NAD(P)-dependent oxidoreductase [Candidatus Binatia bacterium]